MAYLNAVAAQVRVKRCRDALTAELRDHMELQREDYLAAGLPEAEAEARAIADMGDPVLVGGQLDATHRPRTRWAGILAALTMLALSLLLPRLCAGRDSSCLDLLAVLASGGALLLLACTDYTLWVKAALPLSSLWAAGACLRFHLLLGNPTPLPAWLPQPVFTSMLMLCGPQMLAVAMPVVAALLACRLRGRGWDGFLPCLALPVTTAALAFTYRHTGYDPDAVALMALAGFSVPALALGMGFFRVDRRAARCLLGCLAAAAPALFLRDFLPWMRMDQPYWTDVVFPLIRSARPLGRSAGLARVTVPDTLYPLSNLLPAAIIIHFGWIPFALLTLAGIGLFAALLRRFLPMENRMGRLIGLAGVATLLAQVAVFPPGQLPAVSGKPLLPPALPRQRHAAVRRRHRRHAPLRPPGRMPARAGSTATAAPVPDGIAATPKDRRFLPGKPQKLPQSPCGDSDGASTGRPAGAPQLPQSPSAPAPSKREPGWEPSGSLYDSQNGPKSCGFHADQDADSRPMAYGAAGWSSAHLPSETQRRSPCPVIFGTGAPMSSARSNCPRAPPA